MLKAHIKLKNHFPKKKTYFWGKKCEEVKKFYTHVV